MLGVPARVGVLLRRIAPAVRRAARVAGFDDRAIDVLPFPIRQWRPVYVDQLAGIIADVFDSGSTATAPAPRHAIDEPSSSYGTPGLHDVMAAQQHYADLFQASGLGIRLRVP